MPYSRIVLNSEQIDRIVTRMSRDIASAIDDRDNCLALVVLDGAKYFARDLLAKLDFPIETEFIKASSYVGTRSSGRVSLPDAEALRDAVCGRDILLVDDIYDTGLTLSRMLEWLRRGRANSIKTCVLLEKEVPHTQTVTIDFLGTKIDDEFLIGYGLDHNEQYRELPHIGVLSSDKISQTPPAYNP